MLRVLTEWMQSVTRSYHMDLMDYLRHGNVLCFAKGVHFLDLLIFKFI